MNYFNYYTEIEQRFQQRRGALLLLSTLDWALIDTWREAGIPLEAVLRGVDAAFDKREAHLGKRRQKPVNGLAWCAQAVVEEALSMQEAAVGVHRAAEPTQDDGFTPARVTTHLRACAAPYSTLPASEFGDISRRLATLIDTVDAPNFSVETLERALTMLEEKIFAILLSHTPDDELVAIRERSSRELAPHKRSMQAAQIAQIERQFLNKCLLERHRLPRLSLFYMVQT